MLIKKTFFDPHIICATHTLLPVTTPFGMIRTAFSSLKIVALLSKNKGVQHICYHYLPLSDMIIVSIFKTKKKKKETSVSTL